MAASGATGGGVTCVLIKAAAAPLMSDMMSFQANAGSHKEPGEPLKGSSRRIETWLRGREELKLRAEGKKTGSANPAYRPTN
ncbi:hypothetical protein EYF80_060429 [Liparis tanakae]|uniref:Uncharacterized protein n=1 Tax=Liparis tanakae TaxID=230148 RepID=A0A4Z2EM42_9TELE|nr:hypothetical protein EYF80_060429 [Liparis tanakae]